MNIFLRELRAYRNGLFFWILGMVALVASGMAKFAAYSDSGQSINSILDQFPKSFQVIFGLTGFDLAKASGFYGVLFLYIVLVATLHAVLLGAGIIAKEERDRTSEFLFVKPISRAQVVTAKLAAGILNLVILNLATMVSSIYFVDYFGKNQGGSATHAIVILMAGLFMLQLVFFFLGTAVAAASHKPKISPSIATSVLFVTFILSFLINLNDKLEGLKYLTPYKYFDARDLIVSGTLDPVYVSISAALIMVMAIATYLTYAGRDLSV